jgi:kynurenine formamidase
MKATVETIREIVKVLTSEEQQLLKDTFLFGAWGDTETEFLNEEGKVETVGAWGYCTNDAREGGHFAGRAVSTMFRSIYKKLCTANRNQIGAHLSHCNDWWGDGSGDMLFVRSAWNKAWMEWAKAPIQPEEPKNEESAADYVRRISGGEPKQWLFQFNTEGGDYLGRVIISSAKMPTTQEAIAEFAKTAPLAAKLVGKYGAEIITE